MDLAAWKRGERAALSTCVEGCVTEVWKVARRGFLIPGEKLLVLGVEDPGAAEDVVVEVISAALAPASRHACASDPDVRKAIFTSARDGLLRLAQRAGRVVPLPDDPPRGVEALEPVIAGGPLSGEEVPFHEAEAQRIAAERARVDEAAAKLPEQARELIRLLWREGAPPEGAMGLTAPRLHTLERRVRVAARHALAAAEPEGAPRKSLAGQDVALACAASPSALPAPTRRRIAKRVLTRVVEAEPPSFAKRAAIAGGFAAAAGVLLALMLTGVIPGPSDDPRLLPAVVVECKAPCAPGAVAGVRVRAPRGAKRVAVLIVDGRGRTAPLVTDPDGRSVSVPFGARGALVPLLPGGASAQMPAGVDAATQLRAVAVFSKAELAAGQLEAHALGRMRTRGVSIATSPVGAGPGT